MITDANLSAPLGLTRKIEPVGASDVSPKVFGPGASEKLQEFVMKASKCNWAVSLLRENLHLVFVPFEFHGEKIRERH